MEPTCLDYSIKIGESACLHIQSTTGLGQLAAEGGCLQVVCYDHPDYGKQVLFMQSLYMFDAGMCFSAGMRGNE